MTILFAMGILGMTLYLAATLYTSKDSAPDENVSAVPKASEPLQSPPLQAKPVQQTPVSAPLQQTVIDEQKGTELNIQAHQLITERRYVEAIPILQQALKTFPRNSTALAYKFVLYNLGHSLRRVGRAKEAVPYLEQCIKMDPAWEKAHSELQIAVEATKTSE